jgi:hypothetical protein
MSRRFSLVFILVAAWVAGCEGDFDPPVFDSSRDPANNQLPPTPTIDELESQSCTGGDPLVTLSWSIVDTTGIQGYQVYRSAAADIDPGNLIAAVSSTQQEFTDGQPLPGLPGLAPDALYWYRVRALSRDGVPGFRSERDTVRTRACDG